MSNGIELLAPAGTKEAFIGAINAGANAVYISGKNYGARKFANNFTQVEIKELIQYAHIRNVLVFVTINTLIFESELEEVFNYTDYLVENFVDALIVQDLGIIEQFVQRYPNTEIHASTQMNTFNLEQLKYLKTIGVARVILARETSVEIIKTMVKEVDMDLEVFIHGALCVSYSGNCLMSSMQGGRSGNRGECAQPCRLKYKLYKENELIEPENYLLSTKDLMTLDRISEIINSGVKSLKIEGRMKKPEYVIATVRAYREAIDAHFNNQSFDIKKRIRELKSVFNRNYTKGYLLNEKPFQINNSHRPNHQGILVGEVLEFNRGKTKIKLFDTLAKNDGIRIIGETDLGGIVCKIVKDNLIVLEAYKNDIITIDLPKPVTVGSKVMKTLDNNLEKSLNPYLQENYKLINLDGELVLKVGSPIKLTLKTPYSDAIYLESEYIIEQAKKANQTEEKIRNQFDKFGNTFYKLDNFTIISDNLGFIPNIVFNNLRRAAISKLAEFALNKEKRIIKPIKKAELTKIKQDNIELIAKVETKEQLLAAIESDITTIYLSERLKPDNIDLTGLKIYTFMNRIWYKNNNYKGNLVIRDIGGIHLGKDNQIIADSTLNVTNSLSLTALAEKNIQTIGISPESSIDNTRRMIKNFKNNYHFLPNLELTVFGRTDLMLTKYCPITKFEGLNKENCNLCMNHNYYLEDSFNNKILLRRDGFCSLRLIHFKQLNLIKMLPEIIELGVNKLRLDFTDESIQETKEVIEAFQNKLNDKPYRIRNKTYTSGRFIR